MVSCLYKHFMSHVPKDTKKIILFSDPRGTRNLKTTLLLHKYFDLGKHKELTAIEQHFFSPDHCYSSCDRSFQIARSNMKVDEIFVQENLIDAMKQAKKHDPKFIITEMSHKQFYSTKNLENLLSSTKTHDGQQILWSDYQKIICKRNSPFALDVVKYGKTSTENIFLHTKYTPQQFTMTQITHSNRNEMTISKSKYDDLQSIAKYIPQNHREFYHSLKFDQNVQKNNDYALADHEVTDEE